MRSRLRASIRAGHKILARYRSYHGATHGAIALTGDYRRLPVDHAHDRRGFIFWIHIAIAVHLAGRAKPVIGMYQPRGRNNPV